MSSSRFDMDHLAEEEVKRVDSASVAASCSSKWNGACCCGSAACGVFPPPSWFEIRLFYVQISPCAADSALPQLTLVHLGREIGVALEINGARVPAAEPASVVLRKDRVDRGAAEVIYVSTDSIRLSGAIDFEVRDGDDLLLCGALERMDDPWSNGVAHHHPGPSAAPWSSDKDPKTRWSMNCYSAASIASSAFIQTKPGGGSSPNIEVYVAGCCSGTPLILTQTVHHSPMRKVPREGMLDAIREDDVASRRDQSGRKEGLIHRTWGSARPRVVEGEEEEADVEMKAGHSFYPEGGYYDDDGELSWFNAGVRVGVGIGLGVCLGVGIGVGLLMRSYQATTRNLRRQFF